MGERFSIKPSEACRIAATRVKAHVRKEQKLNKCNQTGKKKKSKPSCPVQHPKPWNDRFSYSDTIKLNTSSNHNESIPKKNIRSHAKSRTRTPLKDANKVSQHFWSVTDRKDGSPFMTRRIYCKNQSPIPSQTSRAVSPFDIRRVENALNDFTNKNRSNSIKVNDEGLTINTDRKRYDELGVKNNVSIKETICSWKNSKKCFKLNTIYHQGRKIDCSLTESVAEHILVDLLNKLSYEVEEILVQHSKEIFDLL